MIEDLIDIFFFLLKTLNRNRRFDDEPYLILASLTSLSLCLINLQQVDRPSVRR